MKAKKEQETVEKVEKTSRIKKWIKKYGAIGLILYSVKGIAVLLLFPIFFPNFHGCSGDEEKRAELPKSEIEVQEKK